MTGEMLAWQTERFTELADGPTDGHVVSEDADTIDSVRSLL